MQATIFRNPEQLEVTEVVKKFSESLREIKSFEQDDIDMLAEAYAKNPADKFIIHEKLEVEAAQGDILIWAKGTEMYNMYINKVKNMKKTDRLVLQEGDSMTGDHRIVPLPESKFTLKKGVFEPDFAEGSTFLWHRDFGCISLVIDKPFLVVHREHGNIALPAGEYLFCSQMDSSTLSYMRD